jgi:hypothetical protein
MQYTGLPSRDTTCRTWDGRYLLGREFALLHSDRMPLHSTANLYKFSHFLVLVAKTPILDMSDDPTRTNRKGGTTPN